MPTVCGLCNKHIIGQDLPAHLLVWNKLIPTSGTSRHDAIVQVVKESIEQLGGLVTVEPRNMSDRDNKRGDLKVQLSAETYLVDVTIRNNTASSQLHPADNGRVVREAEAGKKRKYASHCGDEITMVPFAIDVYGSLGQEATDFVNTLATYAKQNGEGDSNFRNQLLDEISVTLQRYNSHMVSRAIHVLGHKESDPFRFQDEQLAMRLSSSMPHQADYQRFQSPTSSAPSIPMSLGAVPMQDD